MYCKNCGCKISTEEKRCSDCGIDIKEIEYCGGFWGLVGEEGKVKTLTSIEEKSKEVLEKNTAEKGNLWKIMLCIEKLRAEKMRK